MIKYLVASLAFVILAEPAAAFTERGVASIYMNGDGYAGKPTAWCNPRRCERGDPRALTAAHKTLARNTRVRVTNLRNGRTVVVRINDRGPYVRGRVIDLTPAGARVLGFSGLTEVRLDVL